MKTPILLIVYNRPDKTLRLMKKLKLYRPEKIYISIDGVKNFEDIQKTEETLKIINMNIDWDCNIYINKINSNLGTRYRIESAIDWIFTKENVAIILEDDCIPSDSFFEFMECMLEKYRDEESIMAVSGHNCGLNLNENYYYLSTLPMTWGWGTWRRAWNLYDSSLSNIYQNRKIYINKIFELFNQDYLSVTKRIIELDLLNKSLVEAWDYRWFAAIHFNQGLTVFPPVNLVENIGFDGSGTHTNDSKSPITEIKKGNLIKRIHNLLPIMDNENIIFKKYLNDRIDKRTLQNYILKKIILRNQLLLDKKYEKIFILGNQELGKMLYVNLSKKYKIQGFVGKGLMVKEIDDILNKSIYDEETLIISSIEGKHEKDVLASYSKNFSVCSWRQLVCGTADEESIDIYLNNHFLHLVEQGII